MGEKHSSCSYVGLRAQTYSFNIIAQSPGVALLMFLIQDLFEIYKPFSVFSDNMHGRSVFAETVGKGIRRYGIIDGVDINGKNICFPVLLACVAVHLVKSLLPF